VKPQPEAVKPKESDKTTTENFKQVQSASAKQSPNTETNRVVIKKSKVFFAYFRQYNKKKLGGTVLKQMIENKILPSTTDGYGVRRSSFDKKFDTDKLIIDYDDSDNVINIVWKSKKPESTQRVQDNVQVPLKF